MQINNSAFKAEALFLFKDDFMKRIIAALLATVAFAAVLTGCGGAKNNTNNQTSASSKAASSAYSNNESSKNENSKNESSSKAESKMDEAERNGRVRDGDGIIGNEGYENRDDEIMDGVEDFIEDGVENRSTHSNDAIL